MILTPREKKHSAGKRILKRVFAAMMTAVLMTGMAATSDVKAAGITYTVSSDSSNLVNIMQKYGFVTFGSFSSGVHIHAPIMVKKLTSTPSNEYCLRANYNMPTTSYIQEFEQLSNPVKVGYSRDTLVVGETYTVTGSAEKFLAKTETPDDKYKVESAGTVTADTATEKYIDLSNLQNSFIAYNKQLSEATASTEGIAYSGDTLTVNAMSGVLYYNMDADTINALNADAKISFPADSTAAVVLNIDMKGTSWSRKPLDLLTGGTEASAGENNCELTNNRVYYNFYDSSKTDKQYTRTINMNGVKGWGTIIAPKASVEGLSNWNGVVVSENVASTGENHFAPAQNPVTPTGGTTPTPSVTVEDIKLIKTVDADGTAGDVTTAVFGLYSDEACTNIVATGSPVLSGENYVVTFAGNGLSIDTTYYLKEKSAPLGYDKSNTVFKCKVNTDGTVTYSVAGSASGNDKIDNVTGFPVCENKKTGGRPVVTQKADISFKKVITGSNVALEGAKFGLYSDAACTTAVQRDAKAYTFTSDAQGVVKFKDLEAGTYFFKELSAPAGYEINTKIYSVTITFSGETASVVFSDGTNNNLTELSVSNDPITPDAEEKGNLVITVVDEKTGAVIPKAKVEVSKPDGTKQEYETNENGQITLNNTPVGGYSVTVTEVPDGYSVVTGKEIKVTVEEGKTTYKEAKLATTTVTTETTAVTTETTAETTDSTAVTTETTKTSNNNSVKTGDSMNVVLFVLLAVASVACAAGVWRLRKRSR